MLPTSSLLVARTLILAAFVAIPFATAQGQGRSDNRDTTPVTRVILVPASDSYDAAEIARARNGIDVVAIFTTDGDVARRLAERIHPQVGGSLVTLARAGQGAQDFARVVVDSVIQKAAPRSFGHAIVLVAEPELFRPILALAFEGRGAELMDEAGPIPTFMIGVRSDNRLTLSRRAPRR